MRGLLRITARRELRSHWRGWTALVLLVGIGAGVVLAAFAGARRTESAFPRLVEASNASDVVVVGDSGPFGFIGNVDLDAVARLPQVEETAETAVSVVFTGSTDSGEPVGPGQLFPFSTDDRRVGRDIERWHLVEGRRADPDRMDEATATVGLAEEFGVEVGDELRLRFTRPEDFNTLVALLLSDPAGRLRAAAEGGGPVIEQLPPGPDVHVRIVGIEASPAEFPPVSAIVAPPLHLTEAFYEEHKDETIGSPLMFVRLRNGSRDLPAFTEEVERLSDGPVSFLTTLGNQETKVERSSSIEATALRLLGAVVGLATAFVFGQAARRQLLTSSRDGGILRALGLTTRELTVLAVLWITAVGVAGAVLAVAVALALSPLTPIGLARFAETNPGVRIDELVLGLGLVGVVVATVLLGLPGVGRAVRVSRGAVREQVALERPSRLMRALARLGAPPAMTMGVGAAIGPGPAGAARAGSGNLLSIVLAVALLVGSACFSASLNHLLATPELYGWTWDVTEGAPALPEIGAPLGSALSDEDAMSDVAAATSTQVAVGDLRVDVLGIDQLKGRVVPTIVEGRAPEGPGELALGTRTLRAVDAEVGEDLDLELGGRTATYRVVGRAVFPDLGDAGGFGRGVLTTVEGIRRLLPDAPVNLFLLRFADGVDVDREAAVVATAFDPVPSRRPERPSDLENLARVDRVPGVLAAVLLTLALATLAHTLLSSLRRRRRHLATLVSLGFVRRQLVSSVLWQSVAETVLTLVVAVPLGVAAGRRAWHLFAENLGVPATPVVPVAGLLVAVPLALVAAVLIGIGPGLVAARTRPATALTSE